MNTVTQDPIELQVADVVCKHHREQQGVAPKIVRAHLLDGMVVIHSLGIYTQTEQSLSSTEEGRKLIKSARRELRSLTRREIEGRISSIVGAPVLRSFWDLDVRTGEQVEVYILGPSLELHRSDVSMV